MTIKVPDAEYQTLVFIVAFLTAILISLKWSHKKSYFPPELTTELKGFAILAIIFSHIGYFLVDDHHFLSPLSAIAGVGVNLFLFLSGYGLTISQLKKPLSILNFYKKRLLKLFVPLWLIITILFLLDFFYLHLEYPRLQIIESYFGLFLKAHPQYALNSPLWYFSLIFFYYLLFPLFSFKKLIYFSPILLFLLSRFLINQQLPLNPDADVKNLYLLHSLAFPLGITFALIPFEKIKLSPFWINILKIILTVPLLFLFANTAIKSHVGEGLKIEHLFSLITMFSILILFLLKNFSSKILILVGTYSYEIYLFHWPLLYRYDFLYKFLPASLATFLYIIVFVLLGFILNKLTNLILKKII